jgi:hypothetical protein
MDNNQNKINPEGTKLDLPKGGELGEFKVKTQGETAPEQAPFAGLTQPSKQSPLESSQEQPLSEGAGGEKPAGVPEAIAPEPAQPAPETGTRVPGPEEVAPEPGGATRGPISKPQAPPAPAEKQPQREEEEQPQRKEEERQDQDQEHRKEREKEEKEKEGEEKEKGKEEGKEESKEGEEKPAEEEAPKEEAPGEGTAEEASAEGEAVKPEATAEEAPAEVAPEAGAESVAPEAAETLAPEAAEAAAEVPAEAVAPGAAGAVAEAGTAEAAEVVGAGTAEAVGAAGTEAGILATGAATAPETMGIGAAVAAGAAGAMEVAKAAEKTAKQIKKASGGLVDIDPTQKIRHKATKWGLILAITLPILFVVLFVILIVYFIFPRFHTDTSNTQNQALISDVTNLATAGKITFESPDDLSQIQKGEIGLTSLKMIKYLASKHDGLTIHYSGTKAVSNPDKKENDPSEFDVTAVDKIKCTDTATKNKLVEFPISLNPKFNWQSQIPTGSIDSVICAVSYYPTLEPPVKGPYADKFGPGEFKLAELTTFAPMASQEKIMELTDEIISANSAQGIDPTSEDSLLPQKIEIPKIYTDSNLAHGGGALEELKSKIDEVYQNKDEYEGVTASDDSIGLHISFL